VFVTIATAVLLLVHVPPVAGLNVEVEPTQIELLPVIDTTGFAFIVTLDVYADTQPVVLVNLNTLIPSDKPVTTPAFVTVAIEELLSHVPPVVGLNVVVEPTHIESLPVIDTIGIGLTVITAVGSETQPVAELVYVKVAVPGATPVTNPELLIVAIEVLLLAHTPPPLGSNLVVN
jgi:hypothetical protein